MSTKYHDLGAANGAAADTDIDSLTATVGAQSGTLQTQSATIAAQKRTIDDQAAQILALQVQPPIPPLTEPLMPTALPPGRSKVIFSETFNTPAPLGSFVFDPNTQALPAAHPYAKILKGYPLWPDTRMQQFKGLGGNTANPALKWGGIYNGAKTLSVHDGYLDANLWVDNGQFWGAAVQPLTPTFLYGSIEFCASFDNCAIAKAAPLLWSDANLWSLGEIDFIENDPLGGPGSGFVHWSGNPSQKDSRPVTGINLQDKNKYRIDWDKGRCRFFVNDVQVGADCTTGVMSVAAHFIWQLEATLVPGTILDPAKSGRVKLYWMRISQ